MPQAVALFDPASLVSSLGAALGLLERSGEDRMGLVIEDGRLRIVAIGFDCEISLQVPAHTSGCLPRAAWVSRRELGLWLHVLARLEGCKDATVELSEHKASLVLDWGALVLQASAKVTEDLLHSDAGPATWRATLPPDAARIMLVCGLRPAPAVFRFERLIRGFGACASAHLHGSGWRVYIMGWQWKMDPGKPTPETVPVPVQAMWVLLQSPSLLRAASASPLELEGGDGWVKTRVAGGYAEVFERAGSPQSPADLPDPASLRAAASVKASYLACLSPAYLSPERDEPPVLRVEVMALKGHRELHIERVEREQRVTYAIPCDVYHPFRAMCPPHFLEVARLVPGEGEIAMAPGGKGGPCSLVMWTTPGREWAVWL